MLQTALEAADGAIPVCVGVSHASTDRAIAFAREAEAVGAHSIMLAPPSLARATDAALRRHYLAVAEAITVPIVVQDHPASSGVQMTSEFLLALAAEAPQCRVIKLEEEPTPPKAGRLVSGSADVLVLGGLGGEMLIEELGRGTHGTMTGFGFPEVLVAVVRRWFAGDREGAAAVFDRYATLIRFENQALLNLPIRKLVYQRRGAIAHADGPGAGRAGGSGHGRRPGGRAAAHGARPAPRGGVRAGRAPRVGAERGARPRLLMHQRELSRIGRQSDRARVPFAGPSSRLPSLSPAAKTAVPDDYRHIAAGVVCAEPHQRPDW